jgi:hypothetical protein
MSYINVYLPVALHQAMCDNPVSWEQIARAAFRAELRRQEQEREIGGADYMVHRFSLSRIFQKKKESTAC